MAVVEPRDWLLTKSERAHPQSSLDAQQPGDDAWSRGNHVRPLVHGATYFAELLERIGQTRPGDLASARQAGRPFAHPPT